MATGMVKFRSHRLLKNLGNLHLLCNLDLTRNQNKDDSVLYFFFNHLTILEFFTNKSLWRIAPANNYTQFIILSLTLPWILRHAKFICQTMNVSSMVHRNNSSNTCYNSVNNFVRLTKTCQFHHILEHSWSIH